MALSLMVAGIFLWVTEPVPVAVSGLVIMVSLPAFGILPLLNATDPATGATTIGVWGGFISNVIFFILASFGITAALLKTKIPAKYRVRPAAADPRQLPRHHRRVHGGGGHPVVPHL